MRFLTGQTKPLAIVYLLHGLRCGARAHRVIDQIDPLPGLLRRRIPSSSGRRARARRSPRRMGTNEKETVLPVRLATPESFAPYGLVVTGRDDGAHGPEDDALDLSAGRPRFYILRLQARGRVFRAIARHCLVTQCLASVGGRPWWLAVAPARDLANPSAKPNPDEIIAFRIPGNVFVLLRRGTWHAGPYFLEPQREFFNLELANTNDVDLQIVDLAENFGVVFAFGAEG